MVSTYSRSLELEPARSRSRRIAARRVSLSETTAIYAASTLRHFQLKLSTAYRRCAVPEHDPAAALVEDVYQRKRGLVGVGDPCCLDRQEDRFRRGGIGNVRLQTVGFRSASDASDALVFYKVRPRCKRRCSEQDDGKPHKGGPR